ncbi:hypothetical protein [Streptomyces sp. NPDC097610]|uniref:hypothetical protein n=1 Tax=Streptomyces sp. NPDC097610 TaxID=3157227 RepID=UPI00331DB007
MVQGGNHGGCCVKAALELGLLTFQFSQLASDVTEFGVSAGFAGGAGRGFAKAFGVVGGAASAAQYPVDVYNYGFEEVTKQLSESLTDPLDVVPDGQGAGCVFFLDGYVVTPMACPPTGPPTRRATGRE